MATYEVRLTREALKDVKKLSPHLRKKLREILENRVAQEPYTGKKLAGDLQGFYSVRLTYQDRIVYVHRARTHYGD